MIFLTGKDKTRAPHITAALFHVITVLFFLFALLAAVFSLDIFLDYRTESNDVFTEAPFLDLRAFAAFDIFCRHYKPLSLAVYCIRYKKLYNSLSLRASKTVNCRF